jgi:phenylalanyl-tRNA synthetase alpha chain
MISLEQIVEQAQADFNAADDTATLENAKAKYLGKTGQITEQMKGLGKLAPEERKAQGAVINAAKERIEASLNARRSALAEAQMQARLNAEAIDVTLRKFSARLDLTLRTARRSRQTGPISPH